MGIFDFLKLKGQTKEKIVQQVSDPQWETITLGGLGLSEKSATLLEEYVGWVYANVQAISEAVSDIKIQLFKLKKNGEVEEITEHPILELLHRPNNSMTKREFIQFLTTYRLLTGESPIRLRGKGEPSELWPIDPLTFSPKIGRTSDGFELITGYEIKDSFNGEYKVINLKPEECIYIKNVNPKTKWRGYGVVEAGQNSIDTLSYSELYNLNFFKNSAVPFTVLYTDQKLSPQVVERLKNSWDSSYRGVNNSFKTAILEAGLKVEKLQTSSKDMDFIEQQRFLRDKLMAMFKTTKVALGITEDVNRANAEASEYVFMKNCVRPKMAQLIESFNEFLLPIFDPKGELFLDFEDPVPRDRVALIQEYSSSVDKWLTKNEIRQLEGYPDLEGGDEIWQALNLTTMSNPTPNTPEVQTTPKTTEDQPEETQETPDEENKAYRVLKAKGKKQLRDFSEQIAKLRNRNVRIKQLRKQLEDEVRKMLKNKIKPVVIKKMEPKYKDMSTKEDTDKYIKTLISNSNKFEKQINDTFKWKYYQPQMEEVLNNLKKGTKLILPKSKGLLKQIGDEFMFEESKYVSVGIDLMTPLLKEILISQGAEAMLTVKPGLEYSLLDAARKYLNQKPTKLAKSITETSYTRVRNSLAEGIKNGEGLTELRLRVSEQYKSLEVYQAEAIARTEVTRATNFAAVDAFKQSGVVEGKEWVVTEDDRLCEFCSEMDGKTVELDDTYFKDGQSMTGSEGGTMEISFDDVGEPPLHVNCRCQLKSVEKFIGKTIEPVKKEEKKVSKDDLLLEEIDKELSVIKRAKTTGTKKEDTSTEG